MFSLKHQTFFHQYKHLRRDIHKVPHITLIRLYLFSFDNLQESDTQFLSTNGLSL